MAKQLNLMCPGCGESEVHEIVAERGTGPLSGQAYFSCSACSWFGNERALCCASEAADRNEILDCLAEDRRRGKPGGSSSSGSPAKKDRKKKAGESFRMDQEQAGWGDQQERAIQVEARDVMFPTVRLTATEDRLCLTAIALSGLSKAKWARRAMLAQARAEAIAYEADKAKVSE